MRLWENPKKEILKEIEFDADGSPITRVRIRLFIKKGRINNYVVQLEHLLENEWRQVIRFNYFHGFAHKDVYNKDGKMVDKKDLGPFRDLKDAVSLAIKDINENYKDYIGKFSR